MNYHLLKIGLLRFVNVRNKFLIKLTKIPSVIYFLKIKTTFHKLPANKAQSRQLFD